MSPLTCSDFQCSSLKAIKTVAYPVIYIAIFSAGCQPVPGIVQYKVYYPAGTDDYIIDLKIG